MIPIEQACPFLLVDQNNKQIADSASIMAWQPFFPDVVAHKTISRGQRKWSVQACRSRASGHCWIYAWSIMDHESRASSLFDSKEKMMEAFDGL